MLSSPNVLLTGTTSIFCQTEARASGFPAFLIRHAVRSRLKVQHTGVLHSSAKFNKALSTVSGTNTSLPVAYQRKAWKDRIERVFHPLLRTLKVGVESVLSSVVKS